jgi:hypothetical protein
MLANANKITALAKVAAINAASVRKFTVAKGAKALHLSYEGESLACVHRLALKAWINRDGLAVSALPFKILVISVSDLKILIKDPYPFIKLAILNSIHGNPPFKRKNPVFVIYTTIIRDYKGKNIHLK